MQAKAQNKKNQSGTTIVYKILYIFLGLSFFYLAAYNFFTSTYHPDTVRIEDMKIRQMDNNLTEYMGDENIDKFKSGVVRMNQYEKPITIANIISGAFFIIAGVLSITKIFTTTAYVDGKYLYLYNGVFPTLFKKPNKISIVETESIKIRRVLGFLGGKMSAKKITLRDRLILDNKYELSGAVLKDLEKIIDEMKKINPNISLSYTTNKLIEDIKGI